MHSATAIGASGPHPPERRSLIAAAAGAVAMLILIVGASMLALPTRQTVEEAALPAESTFWRAPALDGQPSRPLVGESDGRIDDLPWGRSSVQVYSVIPRMPAPGAYVLLLPAADGEPDVFVNGAQVPAAPAGPRYLALPGFRPMTAAIPQHYFRPGLNRIDVILHGAQGRVLAAPLVLESEARIGPVIAALTGWLRQAHAWSAPLALLAALLALSAMLSASSRTWFLALAAAAAAAGCRAALGGTTLTADVEPWRLVIDRLLLGAAILSLLCAGLNWPRALLPSQGAAGILAWSGAGMLGGLLGVTVASGLWGVFEPFSGLWILRLEVVYGLGLGLLSVALAIGSGLTSGRALVGLAVTSLDLTRLVRLQRVEIDATSQALNQEMRRSTILEERQRLARDMHDGLGGTLTSLIARVRTRRIDIDQIEHELMDGLADLRLVVDSLDAVGESLSSALAVFRSRVAPQVEAAGMTLTWDQPQDLGDQAEDPRWILHLYRLLQEAVTNAVRHSKGRCLQVVIRRVGTRGLRIEIADDGVGLAPAETVAGKGLGNMTYRAGRLGAALSFEPAGSRAGTRVVLDIPDDRTAWNVDD